MDAMDIAAVAVAQGQQGAGMAMLKKAQDMAQAPLQLLESLPPPQSANSPGVGKSVDLVA